jgi:general secretion pathway protein D
MVRGKTLLFISLILLLLSGDLSAQARKSARAGGPPASAPRTVSPSVPASAPTPASAGAPIASPTPATSIDKKIVDGLRSGKIMLNFDAVDIRAITKIMAELTKRNIILDSKVTGSITILSSRKVGIKEAWDLYVSALEAAGYGVVDTGKAVKVLPIADARKEDTRYVGMKIPRLKQGYIVAVVLMNSADAELMANTLRPMMTTSGIISAYAPSNAVVITDTAQNVSRLTQIVRHLDSNYRGGMLRVYQPRYVRVKELATALQPLFTAAATTGAGAQAQMVKISAYEPTNSLLIVANDRDFIQIESILSDIDTEGRTVKPEVRTFRVHYLQNADAEDVAKVIANMMEERKKIVEEIKKEQGGTQEAKEKEAFISTKVSADKSTNSLVFYVTDREYEDLKKMITMLDTERKQVLVSAIIAEATLSKLLQIGARWHVANSSVVGSFQGGMSLQDLFGDLKNGNFVLGHVDTAGTTLNIGGTSIFYPAIFGLIEMLQTDNTFNILSAPRLLTQDHKEASIFVGSTQPFPTGTKYDNNNQPIVSYDYKDIGLSLKVTPHISQSELVRMDITQTIKDVTGYAPTTGGGVSVQIPIVSNREVKTYITLGNNQSIIIGGLINNKTTQVMKSVPFFSKIPLLGELFKDKNREDDRTTLFVFITPHIINKPSDLQEITDKYGRIIHTEKAKNEKAPFIIDENKQERH